MNTAMKCTLLVFGFVLSIMHIKRNRLTLFQFVQFYSVCSVQIRTAKLMDFYSSLSSSSQKISKPELVAEHILTKFHWVSNFIMR